MEKSRLFANAENMAVRWIQGIGVAFFSLLCVASLLFTRYFPADYAQEIPYNRIVFFPLTLLGAGLLAAGVWWLGERVTRDPGKAERNLRLLLYGVLAWILIGGAWWVRISGCTPVSDQMMVLTSAQRFSDGNYGRLDYGKYLFMHPHQLGLTAYEELVFRIFGRENLTALLLLQVAGIAGAVYFGYRITRYLFSETRVAANYLILAGLCFPFLLYCTYFYGDVPAVVLSLLAVWQLLRYVKEGKRSSLVLLVLGVSLAVLIRNNSVIVLIACACVLAVKAVSDRRVEYLFCIALLLAGMFAGRQGLRLFYERRCGHEINEGMPMVLYIAMGMQEGDKEAGWYNGYNMYTYQDVCLYHGPTAAELGKAEIRARAKELLLHPAYGADFYWRKFSSQWSEPTYGCFIMTYAAENGRGGFACNVYEGGVNRVLTSFMDSYQLLIYGTALLLLISRRKKREPLENEILLIVILGGILFHMLWEAKSRYVLPYFVMMLPLTAAGICEITQKIQKRGKDKG